MEKPMRFSIVKRFGERLRSARFLRRITQEELGRRIGLTRTQIVNIEAGRSAISIERLPLLAKILDTSCDYFFKERG